MPRESKLPKLGFRNASVPQQLSICEGVARGIATVPPEQRSGVPLSQLQELLTESQAVTADLAQYRMETRALASRQKKILARLRSRTMDCAMVLWAHLGGNELEMRRAGLDIQAKRCTPTGPPGVPTKLRALPVDGGVELRWQSAMRRSLFNFQMTEGVVGKTPWADVRDRFARRGRMLLNELKPGVLYSFRIKAWNSNGESVWSEAVSARPL